MKRIEVTLTDQENESIVTIATKQGRTRKNFIETELKRIIKDEEIKK